MKRHLLIALAIFLSLSGCKKNAPFLVNNDPNLGGPPIGQDGAACTSDKGCDGDLCVPPAAGWDSGYCTTLDCAAAGCNGEDAECIGFLDGSSFCLDGCESTSDCRSGYRCRPLDASGRSVCYRDNGDGPPATTIGASCATDADCRGDLVCDTSAPDGYCTQSSCGSTCPDESVCGDFGSGDRCLDACDTTRDCRTGYICDGFCRPGDPVVPPFDFDTTADLFNVQCGGENLGVEQFGTRWRVTYDVPPGIAGYTIVPFVRSGTLRPMEIGLPSGGTIDLVGDYRHHNIRMTEFQFFDQQSVGTYGEVALDWPIMVPYTPDRPDVLESGAHTIDIIASLDEPCIYLLPSDGAGVQIDLNIVFMGLEGYTAAMAPTDPDIAEVFAGVDAILGAAGIRVGDIRFSDAPREISERYGYIREESELRRATAFGAPRDATLKGHLNVDMFLVEDLSPNGGLVLGLSAGLPGPPGLHGNAANGLVFTGADIGVDNPFVAHIMAHELGHYLGLRHTTEFTHNTPDGAELDAVLGSSDPIEDTAECPAPLFDTANCPDVRNLMFPQAPLNTIVPEITAGQAFVLKSNPAVRGEE